MYILHSLNGSCPLYKGVYFQDCLTHLLPTLTSCESVLSPMHPQRASDNIWTILWLSQSRGGRAASIQQVETKDAASHPAGHRAVPTAQNYLIQNVNSAKVEKLWTRG